MAPRDTIVKPMEKPEVAASKILLAELKGHQPDRPPIWFMRQAGRYLAEYQRLREQEPNFLSFCYSPDLTVEAALQPLRRFALDAAILFSDILVIPDALGQRVRFVEGTGPVLDAVNSAQDVERLSVSRLDEHLDPVYRSLRRLAGALEEHVSLIGFSGSPWTLAVYMVEGRGGIGCERTQILAYEDQRLFGRLITLLTDAVIRHLRNQIVAGAEVVQLFDSWAGGIAAELFRRWVMEPTRQIVDAIHQSFPNVPVIGFARGAGVGHRAYLLETGIDAIAIDAAVPLIWAAEQLQSVRPVQGNLDNLLLVVGGPQREAATALILEHLGSGRFIFNLGHGVLPATPVEHVQELVLQVRKWRRS